MKNGLPVLLFVVFLGVASCSYACGPYFPNSYLVSGTEYRIAVMPEANFFHELCRLTGPLSDLSSREWRSSWSSTLEADLADVRMALAHQLREKDLSPALERYEAMRSTMVKQREEDRSSWGHHGYSNGHLDTARYRLVWKTLPEEFRLYLQGAAALRADDIVQAESSWKALLALPRSKRAYRSTWAAFMLGKLYREREPEKAVQYFERTRRLADEGYSDTLNLAVSSLGWQAKTELECGNVAAAMRLYLEQFRSQDPKSRHQAFQSLSIVCRKTLRMNLVPAEILRDDLCRQILTAWVISRPFHREEGERKTWSDAVRKAGLQSPIEGADRLAWLAYQAGNMALAAEWLEWADPKSTCGNWVKAKLYLREGHTDEAVDLLESIARRCAGEETWHHWTEILHYRSLPVSDVYGDLGVVLLSKKNYVGALDAFLRGGYWMDAAYVAERVLTLAELETYVQHHEHDTGLDANIDGYFLYVEEKIGVRDKLRALLARRLARDEKWHKVPRYCLPNLRSTVAEFAAHYTANQDARLPRRERAKHLFEAGELMRKNGMSLLGTEVEPDWSVCRGNFSLGSVFSNRLERLATRRPLALGPHFKRVISAGKDELKRAQRHTVSPNKRFHYRYHAADMMWACAGLLPDNDLLTARALYNGGVYLKSRDPKSADRFYKALVNRCRGLRIGRSADVYRWFPPTFDGGNQH